MYNSNFPVCYSYKEVIYTQYLTNAWLEYEMIISIKYQEISQCNKSIEFLHYKQLVSFEDVSVINWEVNRHLHIR